MKIAVIGGGLFGCTSAIHLARAGCEVDLFEKNRHVMSGVSGSSYYRLHRGYHYPRSPETGMEGLAAEASFRAEYWPAVIDTGEQYYAIADTSKVSAHAFREHCYNLDLMWWEHEPSEHVKGCEALFRVSEPRIDPEVLRTCVKTKLNQSGVNVHLETTAPQKGFRDRYNRIVLATYDRLNLGVAALGLEPEDYKYQVVERPMVRMPRGFGETGIVVIDGEFCCIDPLGRSDLHIVGHVTETVHDTLTGVTPLCLTEYPSKWKRIRDACTHYIPAIAQAQYVGSTFTVRSVLAGVEETDRRPTLVEQLDAQVIRVFSGKLGTAVAAARQVVELSTSQKTQAA